MIRKELLCFIMGLGLTPITFAGAMGPIGSEWNRVATLSVGPVWTDSGQTQTFFLQPDVQKTYTTTKQGSVFVDGELFLGRQQAINLTVKAQWGLAVAATSSAKVNGSVWEDADPDFDNFFYTYGINHTHVAVKGKLIGDWIPMVSPYISGSVGVGFNNSHDFKITPKIFPEVPAPAFNDHTKTAFTYTAGLGLQRAISSNMQVGVGYEFSDWGKSRLNPAVGQTLGTGLQLNHVYSNELQLSLSYVA